MNERSNESTPSIVGRVPENSLFGLETRRHESPFPKVLVSMVKHLTSNRKCYKMKISRESFSAFNACFKS